MNVHFICSNLASSMITFRWWVWAVTLPCAHMHATCPVWSPWTGNMFLHEQSILCRNIELVLPRPSGVKWLVPFSCQLSHQLCHIFHIPGSWLATSFLRFSYVLCHFTILAHFYPEDEGSVFLCIVGCLPNRLHTVIWNTVICIFLQSRSYGHASDLKTWSLLQLFFSSIFTSRADHKWKVQQFDGCDSWLLLFT